MIVMALDDCVLLSIGSNENPRDMLSAALASLSQRTDILWLSGLYENRSTHGSCGSLYVNGVLVLKTLESLDEFYRRLKQLELDVGGLRAGLLCPIDVDIIAFKDFRGCYKGHVLPLQPSSKDSYVWCACQDLIYIPFEARPSHWELMNWPEFVKWQEFSSHAREYLRNIYCNSIST